jgi:hypothetical protein
VREVAEQQAQSIQQGSEQATVQPRRVARQRSQSWFYRTASRFQNTILTPVIIAIVTALVTSIIASNYVSSRIFDRAFRSGSDPISTKVLFDRDNGVQGLTWALPGGLGVEQVSVDEGRLLAEAGASVEEFNEWMRERGGVDVDASFLKLIVTGQRQSGVVITDMRAKIDECGSPLIGALLYGPPQGERENIQIGFNLDESVPVAREVDPSKSLRDPSYLGREYFRTHTVPLGLGEDQVFSIVAMTSERYCAWYIDIEVFVDGHNQHMTIGYRPEGARSRTHFG